MLSYHNDENLKILVVSEMKKHQEQDQFIKRSYGTVNGKFKGCAIGCTIDSLNIVLGKSYDTSRHDVLEEAIGIPVWLARLQDVLFENLPNRENSQFAVDFLDAIPVGVNIEPIKWKFCAFIMKENIERVLKLPNLSDELRKQVLDALRVVLNLHTNAINEGSYDKSAAESVAESAAWSARSAAAAWSTAAESAAAAAAAAESAAAAASAWLAAESAVWSVAECAELVADSAAWSAVWSAVWSARSAAAAAESAAECTESPAYKRYANELINLLKGA